MKSPQRHLNHRASQAEALTRAGGIALAILTVLAALIIADTLLTAALALPETLSNPVKW